MQPDQKTNQYLDRIFYEMVNFLKYIVPQLYLQNCGAFSCKLFYMWTKYMKYVM